ncbi:MAG: ABC transporter permease subunit [Dehalococcoidia bacterium]|nr:ABC transporter permease subunit [Dehalococcoidia bacterium]
MYRLIRAELFKLRKRPMTRILLLVLAGIMVLFYLLLFAISRVDLPAGPGGQHMGNLGDLLGLPVALPFGMSLMTTFGSVLAVILTASAMGSEYNWRTIRTAVVSSESRSKLLAAKLIAVGIYILGGMILGLAAGVIMSLITTAIGGYKFDFGFATGGYLWNQFLQFWRTFYVLLPYVLFGFMFSIVGRSAMPGIALGIGVFFLESIVTTFMTLAGGWIARIPDYLPTANVRAINALADLPSGFSTGMGGGFVELPGIAHATITLAVYNVLFIAVAFHFFHRRDVTG